MTVKYEGYILGFRGKRDGVSSLRVDMGNPGVSLFLMTPAMSVLSFMLGVIGSSRAKDARSAQNISVITILPIFIIIGVQITGQIWFTPLLSFILALAIFVIDVFVLRVAVRLFQRESIISWRR